jgi:cytochrome c
MPSRVEQKRDVWMRKLKHKTDQKWLLLGLVPLAAGVGWMMNQFRKRPIPRDRAMVPIGAVPKQSVVPQTSIIAVTGADSPQDKDPAREQGLSSNRLDEEENQGDTIIPQTAKNRQSTGREAARSSDQNASQTGHAGRHHGETSRNNNMPDHELRVGHAIESHTAERVSFYVLMVPFVILAIAIALLSRYQLPKQSQAIVPGGNVERGRMALQSWGCGSCHTIPGVTGAYGKVGPNLEEVGMHSFIAGHLENTPDNMILWIMKPQEISPGNGMPDTGVTENMARDMAAYLYSLSNNQRPGNGANSFQISR